MKLRWHDVLYTDKNPETGMWGIYSQDDDTEIKTGFSHWYDAVTWAKENHSIVLEYYNAHFESEVLNGMEEQV